MDDLDRLAYDLAACRDLERVARALSEDRPRPPKRTEHHAKPEPDPEDCGSVGRDIGRAILRACRTRRLLPVTGWWG